jgi:hypothetical protein
VPCGRKAVPVRLRHARFRDCLGGPQCRGARASGATTVVGRRADRRPAACKGPRWLVRHGGSNRKPRMLPKGADLLLESAAIGQGERPCGAPAPPSPA